MDVKKTITDKNGNQKEVKIQMPSIGQVLNAINQRGFLPDSHGFNTCIMMLRKP